MLQRDPVSRLLLPSPDAAEELLAAQVVARLALAPLQLALDHHLGGDPRMIDPGHPAEVEAAHALVARERVLDGGGERVPQVQRAGDVRRRKHHRERGLVAHVLRAEEPLLFPPARPSRLDRSGLVPLVEIALHAPLAHCAPVDTTSRRGLGAPRPYCATTASMAA